MKITGILIGVLSIFINLAHAQEGDFFLYSYYSPISNTDNQNLAVLQGDNGMMYFANTKGVITYDGVQWKIINTLSTPYSLAKNEYGTIFVGCRENFGYLEEDIFGKTIYKSISPANKDFGEINQIYTVGDKIYFYTDRIIFCVSQESKKIYTYWMANKENYFAGMFVHKENAYVNIEQKGIHKLNYEKPDKLKMVTSSLIESLTLLLFSIKKRKKLLLALKTINYFFMMEKNLNLIPSKHKNTLKKVS